ncbi:hypothetical protein GEMRC1_009082 [Eukaryota sp. GEM-RC1]
MISIVNSSASFDSVAFDTINAFSLFTANNSSVFTNLLTFSSVDSVHPFQFTASSSLTIENSLFVSVFADIIFYFENANLSIINTELINATTQSFSITKTANVYLINVNILDTFVTVVFLNLEDTYCQVQNLTVQTTKFVEMFQVSQSIVDLYSIDFGSTNSLTTSLFNMSLSTVNVHDINVGGPFNSNLPLIQVLNSNFTIFEFNASHLSAPLLSSYSSFTQWNDISILNSTADFLVSFDFSNISCSNVVISNSHLTNDVLLAISSTIFCDQLYLDHLTTSNVFLFSGSSVFISNSELHQVKSDESFIHLVGSKLQIENLTTSNFDTIFFIKLDRSDIYSNIVLLLTSQIDSVIFSQNSNGLLSQFSIDSTNIKEAFTALHKSSVNFNDLYIVGSYLTTFVDSYESNIELNQVKLLNISFVNSTLSSLFFFYKSMGLLSNIYAGVINVPIIISSDSCVSCRQIEIDSIDSDISISLKYSNLTLIDSRFHNVSGSFMYTLNTKMLLQDVTVSGLTEYNEAASDQEFNDDNFIFNLIDLYSSNFIAMNLKVNDAMCQYLIHSSNSTLSLETNIFANSVFNSVLHCRDTNIQSEYLIFKNLLIFQNCVTFLDSSCSLNSWYIHDIKSLKLIEVWSSSLFVSTLTVTDFDSLSIFNINDSVVKLQDVFIYSCESVPLEPDGESYVTIINSRSVLYNFKFSGCISQSIFKSDFNVTNSSLTLTDSSEFLLLSSLHVQNSSLLFSSGYPIISKFVTIDQESEILGTDSVLDLSELFFNISISPTQHCCNTSFCSVSLKFDDVHYLEELLDLSINSQNDFSYNFYVNSLDFFSSDIVSFSALSNSIYFNLSISQMLFSYQLFLPICPIEFVSLEPPTRGRFVPLLLLILG